MADIGEPLRRRTVVPLTEPVEPRHDEPVETPIPMREPVEHPSPVPA